MSWPHFAPPVYSNAAFSYVYLIPKTFKRLRILSDAKSHSVVGYLVGWRITWLYLTWMNLRYIIQWLIMLSTPYRFLFLPCCGANGHQLFCLSLIIIKNYEVFSGVVHCPRVAIISRINNFASTRRHHIIYINKVITTMVIRPLDNPTWCAQAVVADLRLGYVGIGMSSFCSPPMYSY